MAAEQNGNDVEIRQLPTQPILSIRGIIRTEQLGEAMGDRIQALRGHLQQHHAQPAGPPFVRYHTFGNIETDFELSVPVTQPVAGEGRVTGDELHGGPAATTWHFGPHDKLGEAYSRLAAWQKEHGREPDGPTWEVYHWIDLNQADDPSIGDPTIWRTQLVQPVR